jgi:hypothetical protein
LSFSWTSFTLYITSDSLEETNADINEEENSSLLALFGNSPTTSPLEQKVKDLEAMLIEDHPIRGLLSNEEYEPRSDDSTSVPSIAVDINADNGERDLQQPLEPSAIDGEFGEIYFFVSQFF